MPLLSCFSGGGKPRRVCAVLAVSPTATGPAWQGWGTSLAWFAHALGHDAGTRDAICELLFGKEPHGQLGLNIVRCVWVLPVFSWCAVPTQTHLRSSVCSAHAHCVRLRTASEMLVVVSRPPNAGTTSGAPTRSTRTSTDLEQRSRASPTLTAAATGAWTLARWPCCSRPLSWGRTCLRRL
jgi:hypothetical protein